MTVFVCPVCRAKLGGADYRQDRPPLVPVHNTERITFERRGGLNYPVTHRTPCPMSGEPIPAEAMVNA
jgi:hypothetical protein